MRMLVAVAVLALGAGSVRADVVPAVWSSEGVDSPAVEQVSGVTKSLVTKSAFIDHHTGCPVAVSTQLHPVVGSVHKGHLYNPLTHTTNYKSTVYNPVLGTFPKYKFRK
jgi:hypothetical protein